MPSSRRTNSPRRKTFLNLSAQIEGQLRQAYDRKFKTGQTNQAMLATKLGIDRSAVHRRLMGHTNMTTESIADMVWGLDHAIKVEIFDPSQRKGLNHWIGADGGIAAEPPAPKRTIIPVPASPEDPVKKMLDGILKGATTAPVGSS